jgi:hypothetical protein
MASNFSDGSSSHRKRVIEHLSTELTYLNVSIAYNGLFRHNDHLMCGKSRTEGTDVLMFHFKVDLVAENPAGPPILTLSQLDKIIRRKAYEKAIILPVEKYKMFIVRTNGIVDISSKKTPKMRMIVDEVDSKLILAPGSAIKPDPERRMLFLFYGDPEKAKADINNILGRSKARNINDTVCSDYKHLILFCWQDNSFFISFSSDDFVQLTQSRNRWSSWIFRN